MNKKDNSNSDYNRNIKYTIKGNKEYVYAPIKVDYNKYLLINSNVIIDTNCLISKLDLIKKIIELNKCTIIIPLVVIMELNGLKNNFKKRDNVIFILDYLKENIKKNKIKLQTIKNNFVYNIDYYNQDITFNDKNKNIDDLIIKCCLYNKTKNIKSYLLTFDKILKIKAKNNNIKIYTEIIGDLF